MSVAFKSGGFLNMLGALLKIHYLEILEGAKLNRNTSTKA